MASSTLATSSDPRGRISGGTAHRNLGRIEGLDGVRAIAAGSVVVYHILGSNGFHAENIIGPYTNRLGNIGVAIFLVLSGFLLYLPFVRANTSATPNRSFQSFWWRRFLRIYPAYWLVYFVQVVFFDINRPPDAETALTHILLLGNYLYGGRQIFGGLDVGWTLSLEMSFYLALPLVAWLVRRVGSPKTTADKFRNEFIWIALIVMLGPAYRLLATIGDVAVYKRQWLPGYADWFGLGMLLAVLRVYREHGGRIPAFLAFLQRRPLATFAMAFTLLFATAHIGLPLTFGAVPDDSVQLLALFNGIASFLFLIPFTLSKGRNDHWALTPLYHPIMVWLGVISYGIYLWHQVLNRAYSDYLIERAIEPNLFAQFVVVSLGTIVLSFALHYLIEQPLQRSKTLRKFDR